jgi:large conductance mechanosensitive channel
MLEEFRKFVLRDDVAALTVGVVVAVAFGAIVASLVDDIILQIFGAVAGGLDFSKYYLP